MDGTTTRRQALCLLSATTLSLALAACQTGGGMTGTPQGASGSGFAHLTRIRSDAGLPALSPDAKLEKAAMRQAGYMASAGRMDHDTGWRRDFATRMKQGDIAAPAAENLAHGRMEPRRLFGMWMDSAGHRRNMLDERFQHYGLAYAKTEDGRRYWALVLGR
jgi:uncharacterized protein YkwD